MTLNDLYIVYAPLLRRYALRLSSNADTAEDLVQDTIVRCMGHVELLKLLNAQQREAWLCRTLKNLFIDKIRRRKLREAMVQQWGVDDAYTPASFPDFTWMSIVDSLPDSDRQIIEQRFVLGMTSTEIAEALGIPSATVRSRLHLLMKRLRSSLGETH